MPSSLIVFAPTASMIWRHLEIYNSSRHHKRKNNHDDVKTNGKHGFSIQSRDCKLITSQLSKEEEGEETEVRREDQDKINRFSTLHQKEKLLQAELKTKEVR